MNIPWNSKEVVYGFLTLGMDASVNDEVVRKGEELYFDSKDVSDNFRELLAKTKSARAGTLNGIKVEFDVIKTKYKNQDWFCASGVTLA